MPDKAHSRQVLLMAFLESLDVMGQSGKRIFLDPLQEHNLNLYGPDLSLSGLATGIRELFGDSLSDSIMRLVFERLDEIYNIKQV